MEILELDDKCKKILDKLSKSNFTFSELIDQTEFNDPTLTRHLAHLKAGKLIINIDKQYQLNTTKKYSITPFTIPRLEIHMQITKRDKQYEYLSYEIIRVIKNESDVPLTSISSYFGDEKVGKRWEEINLDYQMILKNKPSSLYKSNTKPPEYFYENSPHMKKFKVDFKHNPIYKGEERKFVYTRDWETTLDNRKYTYAPDVYAEDVKFYLTFPKNLDYDLTVFEINKYTYEERPSHKPKKKNNQIIWEGKFLPPHNYLDFHRTLID
jgi:hypothetical protein